MILGGLIASNGGGSGKGGGASELDPGSILAGANQSGFITHLRTTFVSVCLKKLIVRVSIMDVSRKVITLDTSEHRGNGDGSCGDHN